MGCTLLKAAFMYLVNFPRYAYGLWRISRLKKPILTVFGSKGTDKTDKYYQQASDLAGILVKQGISVLTGGGPGIMESALCGARSFEQKGRSLGIGVKGINIKFQSVCGQETILLGDFAARKKLLIFYSIGFIAFPGGIGTLDEILEVINLIKTKKIEPIPIVLIGTEYWKPFVDWFSLALEKKFIASEYAKIFQITDDINLVLEVMIKR